MATDDRKESEHKRVRQGSQEKIGKNGGKRRDDRNAPFVLFG